MIDYQRIIDDYYGCGDSELKTLLLMHSRAVADKALQICDRHPELRLDRDFIEAAAMLHDIGIIRCDAPRIHCHGTEPYIRHGILGAEMLKHAQLQRICRRHTGAGITRAEVVAQNLPLPLPDDDSEPYLPETVEEKLICYADKFFSKTKLHHEKNVEEAEHSLAKFGEEGIKRFREWAQWFGS